MEYLTSLSKLHRAFKQVIGYRDHQKHSESSVFKRVCLPFGIDMQSLADNIVTQDNRLLLLDKHLEEDAHLNSYSIGFNEMPPAQVWPHF